MGTMKTKTLPLNPEPGQPAWFRWPLLLLVSILCLWPVFHVGGFQNGFTYYNAFPVIVAFMALGLSRSSIISITFGAVCAGIPVLGHLAWIFDWGKTQTGSSTSGLIFLVIPFWAILFAGIAAAFSAWLKCRIVSR